MISKKIPDEKHVFGAEGVRAKQFGFQTHFLSAYVIFLTMRNIGQGAEVQTTNCLPFWRYQKLHFNFKQNMKGSYAAPLWVPRSPPLFACLFFFPWIKDSSHSTAIVLFYYVFNRLTQKGIVLLLNMQSNAKALSGRFWDWLWDLRIGWAEISEMLVITDRFLSFQCW